MSILSRRSNASARRGVVVVLVMVVLMVIALIGVSLLKSIVTLHRQVAAQQQAMQAQWLAESGLDRARHKLAGAAQYQGETWMLPAERLGGQAGRVEIKLQSNDDGKKIVVDAFYPDREFRRSVHHAEITLSAGESR